MLNKHDSVVAGALLFWGANSCAKLELAEALTKQLFGAKMVYDTNVLNNFVLFDMFSLPFEEANNESFILGKLLDIIVKVKTVGCLVYLENIHLSSLFRLSILPKMTRGDILENDGRSFSFRHSVIVVSSYAFHEMLRDCDCIHGIKRLVDMLEHESCVLGEFYRKIGDGYGSEFLSLFDDLLVFPFSSAEDHMAISRRQTRKDASMRREQLKRDIIFYPSEAAIINMTDTKYINGVEARKYMNWYEENHRYINTWITEAKIEGDMVIVYIDQLVGLEREFSYRFENGRFVQEAFKSFFTVRRKYHQEMVRAREIQRVFHLCERLQMKRDAAVALQVVAFINSILGEDDGNEVVRNPRNKATRAVIGYLRMCHDIESKGPAASLLCLGLRPENKQLYAESLAADLVVEDGEQLVEVNLSNCKRAGSFFECRTSTGLLLTEVVKSSPSSVVLFHQLEEAHSSVFGNILSILERGVAEDSRGKKKSFEKCVVIIISNLGNKEIIGKLFIDSHIERMKFQEFIQPVVKKGLRYELLHRVDHLLLFHPFSNDQLNRFTTMALKSLKEKPLYDLYRAFCHLFDVEFEETEAEQQEHDTLDQIVDHIRGALY